MLASLQSVCWHSGPKCNISTTTFRKITKPFHMWAAKRSSQMSQHRQGHRHHPYALYKHGHAAGGGEPHWAAPMQEHGRIFLNLPLPRWLLHFWEWAGDGSGVWELRWRNAEGECLGRGMAHVRQELIRASCIELLPAENPSEKENANYWRWDSFMFMFK